MYGSWNTDISGISVESGAVVIGPKCDRAELDLLCDLALAAERAGWWCTTFILPPEYSGQLVGEALRGERGAVLGRVDVAHAQVLVLSQHDGCSNGKR